MKRVLFFITIITLTSTSVMAQTLQEADSLHQLGRELAETGKIAEARKCDLKAMEIRKALLGEVSEDYITTLNNYAVTFMMEEDYVKAAELQDQVMDLCSRLSEPHAKLSLFSRNAGYVNYMLDNHGKAIKYWEIALPLVEKFSKEYEGVLAGLDMMYEKTGDKQGIYRIMALMEEHNQHELTLPCDEPGCMSERARYYASIGNHAMAKEWYLKALSMPMDIEAQISVYENYAQFMAGQIRDYATGAEYQYKAANLQKDMTGENEDYANSIYQSGLLYCLSRTDEGRRKAIECCKNACKVFLQTGNLAKVAQCNDLMGNCFGALHDFAKAKECYREALAYYEEYEKDSDNYPKMLERVASSEKFNKEYEAAIEHYKQVLIIYEQRGMMEQYADAENGLNMCYRYAGIQIPKDSSSKYEQAVKDAQLAKLDEIIAEEMESLELTRNYLGKLMYARSLGIIAGCHVQKEDYKEAIEYYNLYMEAIREAVRDEFRVQNESERMNTWNQEATTILEIQDLSVSLPAEQQNLAGNVAALAYDAELLSKGMLLNSSIEFEKVLNDLDDKNLSRIYQQIKDYSRELERLRQEAKSDEDLEKILSLTQEIQQLQIELNKGCREMDDFTRYISYDWHDVQSSLTDRDVSIEFASIGSGFSDNDSQMVALVLTKDMPQPSVISIWNNDKIINCFDSDELHKTIRDSLMIATVEKRDIKDVIQRLKTMTHSSDSPYRNELFLYLNRLEHQADTTTTRFFFPELMIILSYKDLIRQDDVIYDSEYTGNLVWGPLTPYLKDKDRIFFSADGLFNSIGIEYLQYKGLPLSEQFEVYRLSTTKELCYNHDKSKPSKAALFGNINYNDDATASETTQRSLASLRGASEAEFADLSHTLREVNDIRDILRSSGVNDTEIFRDTEASKKTFMELSNSRINLLHIATHGLYKETDRATDAESMLNSIIAFAGANLEDDALVTAAEIANMDLRHCDMAVLSACETGLGKQGSDGVFGLQRGFKNAGVHTLLMSLKNVYDDSTADLMISFYRHLTNGASKREALVKAQQEIRAKGFNDPKYWATFILLDAI